MASLKIMDYDVEFPYSSPYEIQKTYMEKVIDCLHKKVHGVLESPTGTGKTLCLLAPVAAWVKKQKLSNVKVLKESDISHDFWHSAEVSNSEMAKWGNKKKSIVWYTARTHSQLAQAISELRKCDIKGLNVRVLGARDQLCINPEVLSEEKSYIKTIKCKELTKNKNCKFHRKLNQDKNPEKYYHTGEVMDIEDLVTLGKNCGVCPYYLSKTAIETADIVFLPYNYIIDKDSRDANSLQFNNDVIIFDEGHNVPATCEESYEFSVTNLDIALGIKNVKDLMMNLAKLSEIATEDEEKDIAKHADNLVFLAELMQKLESGLEKLKVSEELMPVSTLYKFFKDAGINSETSNKVLGAIQDFYTDSISLNLSGTILATFHMLEKMLNIVYGSTIMCFGEDIISRSFKCCVSQDSDKMNVSKKVSLFCFNPSFGIRAVLNLGVQSIIITSGTLSPIRALIHELNLPNPITLQNGHIAKKCQVPFLILGKGVNNVRMDAAYTNRSDPKYVLSLGMTLTNLICSVPDGVLLLFSSYTMMQNLKEAWESDNGIWKRLSTLKRVFIEPRGKEGFINCIENYKRAIQSGNGAILMGVLRGKISEGMDFKDQYCRAVFIVGVPFPPVRDPRVKGKEKYSEALTIFDPKKNTEQKLYNNSFMSVEAMKATNQAIGRVIRHGQDYGAIILVDYRFCWARLFQHISPWLRGPDACEKNFPQAKKTLSEFFRDVHLGKLGVPEVRCQRVDGNGCPIADYITYEEYEHRKTVKTPAPQIVVPVSESKKTVNNRLSKSTDLDLEFDLNSNSNSGLKPRPETDLRFDRILNLYMTKKDNIKILSKDSDEKPSSVFDAMDIVEKNNLEREKLEFRGYYECAPCQDLSSAPVPRSEPPAPPNKKLRIKVKPFTKMEEQEPEKVDHNKQNPQCSNDDKLKSSNKKELKIALYFYFRRVKKELSEEEVQELKRHSYKYMRGETTLSDIIDVLDKTFSSQNRKHLYSGFGVCIQSKDRQDWENACKMRDVYVSPS